MEIVSKLNEAKQKTFLFLEESEKYEMNIFDKCCLLDSRSYLVYVRHFVKAFRFKFHFVHVIIVGLVKDL